MVSICKCSKESEGYDAEGRDAEGYNRLGLDSEGFRRNGLHIDTGLRYSPRTYLDQEGYDCKGYKAYRNPVTGKLHLLNRDGYDEQGRDIDGFNRKGTRAGFSKTTLLHYKTGTPYNLRGCDLRGLNEGRRLPSGNPKRWARLLPDMSSVRTGFNTSFFSSAYFGNHWQSQSDCESCWKNAVLNANVIFSYRQPVMPDNAIALPYDSLEELACSPFERTELSPAEEPPELVAQRDMLRRSRRAFRKLLRNNSKLELPTSELEKIEAIRPRLPEFDESFRSDLDGRAARLRAYQALFDAEYAALESA